MQSPLLVEVSGQSSQPLNVQNAGPQPLPLQTLDSIMEVGGAPQTPPKDST